MNSPSYIVYGNPTFHITVNPLPCTGTEPRPHAQSAFPQSADFEFLMRSAMQGMNFVHAPAPQPGFPSYPERAPSQADYMRGNNFDDFQMSNHSSSGPSPGRANFECYDFQAPSMPENSRWLPSAQSGLSESPESYDDEPLPTGFEQEDTFSAFFNTPKNPSAAHDIPHLDSLGLFSEPSSSLVENSFNSMGDSFLPVEPTASEFLQMPWPANDSRHSEGQLDDASVAGNTPAEGYEYSGGSSYEGSAGSDWDSSSVGLESVPPTAQADNSFLNNSHWDSAWPFAPLEDGASKHLGMEISLDDWTACERLLLGPHVGIASGSRSAL